MKTSTVHRSGIISWALNYPALPITIMAILSAMGVLAICQMSRDEFPKMTERQAVIMIGYPGANSEQVAAQLARPVADFLFINEQINKKKTSSYSFAGGMYVVVELCETVRGADIEQFWNKLRGSLPELHTNLPVGVLPPVLKSEFGKTASILFAVKTAQRRYSDLSRYVDTIEDQLRQVDMLARISHMGELNDEITVTVDPQKMLKYQITAEQITGALQNASAVVPTSPQKGDKKDLPINILANARSVEALGTEIIKVVDGRTIQLREVATLKQAVPEDRSCVTSNGERCIIVSLEMAQGGQIVKFGGEVERRLAELKRQLPKDIHIVELTSQPKVVQKTMKLFFKEFLFTLFAVFAVIVLLLPVRVALIAIATIPITITATLGSMYLLGFALNTVTLASLFLALGNVVDDPIVVIDGYLEKLGSGRSRRVAALESARELCRSVFIATLVIGATFLPLKYFLKGMAADFINEFPDTIIIALGFSFVISMLVIPNLNRRLIASGLRPLTETGHKKTRLGKINDMFAGYLAVAMASPRRTSWIGTFSVVLGVTLMATLPLQLFPTVDRNQLAIEVILKKGSSLKQSAAAVQKVEAELRKDPRVVSFASAVGGSLPRFHPAYAPSFPAPNCSQLLVQTISEHATEELIADYQRRYANFLPNGNLRMKQLSMVSAAAPIEIRISGGDIPTLTRTASQIVKIGREKEGVIWPRTDFEQPQEVAAVQLERAEAARYLLNRRATAQILNASLNGETVSEVWEGAYRVPVKLKIGHGLIGGLSELPVVAGQSGADVRLAQLAKVRSEWEPGQIVHRNGIPTVTVRMDVQQGQNAIRLLKLMRPKIDSLVYDTALEVSYGGEQELQDENLTGMILALSISFVLIFVPLLYYFGQVRQTLLALSTILFSIPGVGLGLFILRHPLTFPAFVGILGVCAIVVRNGIILIRLADEYRISGGMTAFEAVAQAARERMRPIFLTATAAATGVSTQVIGGSSLWAPLGTVIFFGLLGSMVLTLFVLPALYVLLFSTKRPEKSKAIFRPTYIPFPR